VVKITIRNGHHITKPVYILNGPNLNLLGTSHPEIYGHERLGDIETRCQTACDDLVLGVSFHQSNHERQLVESIHEVRTAA